MLVSAVTQEGFLAETIRSADGETTAFATMRGDGIEVVPTLRIGGDTVRPPRPSNNLLKHEAVLLASGAEAFAGTEALIAEVVAYLRRYVSLPNEARALAASYVLLSWVYDAFNELPYLRFRGDYGTGKTRALLVIGSICYKPFFASGASTVSPIFHTLDTFQGTLVFDEADFRFTDERAELVKIFNNGNAKGFPVLRTQVTSQKEFDPRAFTVFGPKIVGMRRSFDDRALESRFLTVEMESGQAHDIPINLPDAQKVEALELRNRLLMFRFRSRLGTKLDPALADASLEPRLNQIVLPLLSVVTDEAIRATIRSAVRSLQTNIVSDRSASTEGQLIEVLAGLVPERGLALHEIADAFRAKYAQDYERPILNRWVGGLLRRLGIVLYKSNGVVTVAPGQDERIAALCKRYGIGGGERVNGAS